MKLTLAEVLGDLWPLAILAYAVSVTLTPIIRWIAYRYNIVDRPDDKLKPHARPVAYMGGLAVCGGLVVALAVATLMRPSVWRLSLPVGLSAIVIALVGLLDDLRNLKPRQKILGQMLAAGVLYIGLVQAGVHLSASRMFFGSVGIHMHPFLAMVVSGLLTLAVVVTASNATNLIDGLDGLCGGVTGIIALGFLALAVYLAMWGQNPQNDDFRVILCLVMAGAVLGFLPYNVPPASIFLGDAGSMLLGHFVATMILLFALEGTARWFLAAGVIFGLPILDTSLAVVRRAIAGVNIFTGDRSHLYDQLVDRGMSVKRVVGLFYLLALAAAGLGLFQAIVIPRGRYGLVLDVLILGAVFVLFAKKGMLHPPVKK